MNVLNPAKIAVICFIFLLVLYLISGLDLAVSLTLAACVFLFNLPSVWLFLSSFAVFGLFLVFNFLSLNLDFIADLSLSSYLLFAVAIVLYFREGQKNKWFIKLPFSKEVEVSSINLLKIGGILAIIFLIYPLTNAYIAAITGYIVFCLVFKKAHGKYAIAAALFFLVASAFLLISGKDKIAEESAVFTYYFLVVGVLQEVVDFIRNPQAVEEEEKTGKIKLHSEKLKSFTDKVEISGKNFHKLIIIGSISLVISFILVYVFLTYLGNRTFSLPKISFTATKKVKPTVTPSFTPTPTLTFAEVTARLKLKKDEVKLAVENGTEITGLAASTAAILREDGFKDITVGNAERQDYKNWELTLKQRDGIVVEYLKYLLNLTTVDTKEATTGAEYDVQLTIGEKK